MVLADREIMKSSQILSKSEQVFCCLQEYFLDCGEYWVGILLFNAFLAGDCSKHPDFIAIYQLGYLKDGQMVINSDWFSHSKLVGINDRNSDCLSINTVYYLFSGNTIVFLLFISLY